jgi:hypothetical protein
MKGTRETNLGLKAHCHLVIWALFADRCYKKTSSVVFMNCFLNTSVHMVAGNWL